MSRPIAVVTLNGKPVEMETVDLGPNWTPGEGVCLGGLEYPADAQPLPLGTAYPGSPGPAVAPAVDPDEAPTVPPPASPAEAPALPPAPATPPTVEPSEPAAYSEETKAMAQQIRTDSPFFRDVEKQMAAEQAAAAQVDALRAELATRLTAVRDAEARLGIRIEEAAEQAMTAARRVNELHVAYGEIVAERKGLERLLTT